MTPWKVILATMVIFGCGVVTGGLLITAVSHTAPPETDPILKAASPNKGNPGNPPPSPLPIQRAEFLRRMDKQLSLTPDQRERIAKIIHSSQDRTKPLWDIIAPQMRKEVKRVQDEIRQELTPEQQVRFADLLKPKRRQDNAPAAQSVLAQPSDVSRTNLP